MKKVKCVIIGTGEVSRLHMQAMLGRPSTTSLVGFVEPHLAAREATKKFFADKAGSECPPFYDSIRELVARQGLPDAAMICSPHKFHFENAKDCLELGMDVCMEKPMVMNADEARKLIRLRDKTGRRVMVAFPGSLSPAIQKAKQLIARGAIGEINSISACTWQAWKKNTAGTWRQIPEISGGGFLFDAGSHMINTVVDLVGEDVASVSALLDNRGAPVEINSSVSARSKSGVMLSLLGSGDSIQCHSLVMVYGNKGVLKTGIWGGGLWLQKSKVSDFKNVACPKAQSPWAQFLKVRQGRLENPCPAEVGLRFAKLMDMIRKSNDSGKVVAVGGKGK